jgi:hypothetical protein
MHHNEEVLGGVDARAQIQRRERLLGVQDLAEREVAAVGDLRRQRWPGWRGFWHSCWLFVLLRHAPATPERAVAA